MCLFLEHGITNSLVIGVEHESDQAAGSSCQFAENKVFALWVYHLQNLLHEEMKAFHLKA